MIVAKKHKDTTPDGVVALFQLPTDFVAGSVDCLEIKNDRSVLSIDITEIGNGFIQTTQIPASGSVLLFNYLHDDVSIALAATSIAELKPWDAFRILEIGRSIDAINQTITVMTKAILNRISKEEMSILITPLVERLDVIERSRTTY